MEDHLYIHNAGLVILNPFLPRYFSQLDMLEDKRFRSLEDAHRAVLLLQYVCSGQTETPEHMLVFNKVLCGLSVDDPVPSRIELTDSEKEVSQLLLNSILQNWEMMKNLSVDNLRGAFILRDGRLKEKENIRTLDVEPKSFDVILNSLPWTLSIISFPWMTKKLDVAWQTQV